MNLIGSLSSMTGNRSVNVKPASPQGQRFQQSLQAARTMTDGSVSHAFISPELGAPTLQWYYNN